jgi:hypothetical protein
MTTAYPEYWISTYDLTDLNRTTSRIRYRSNIYLISGGMTRWYKHKMALFDVIAYSIIKYGACSIKPALFNCCVFILVFRRLWLILQSDILKSVDKIVWHCVLIFIVHTSIKDENNKWFQLKLIIFRVRFKWSVFWWKC